MTIIIDAYNLASYLFRRPSITPHQRIQFNALLYRYARRKKHRLIAVYDGGPMAWPTQEIRKGVTTIFAGAGRSADDEIIAFLRKTCPNECLLITADRTLRDRAAQINVMSLTSQDFALFIQPQPTKKPSYAPAVHKIADTDTDTDNKELDMLMQEAALQPYDKPNLDEDKFRHESLPKPQSKLSKKERAFETILKKL